MRIFNTKKPEQMDMTQKAGYLMPPRMGSSITEEKLRKAKEELKRYQSAKAKQDSRIINNEAWWEGRSWDDMEQRGNPLLKRQGTMWTVNTVMGKHADMMEAYPEPAIKPRDYRDKQESEKLTHILPVILEQNEFKSTYNLQAWKKNKSGTAIYGVFWNAEKLNGLGDVEIAAVEPLNFYFEPGIKKLQDSRNIFVVEKMDRDVVEGRYPHAKGKTQTNMISVQEYKKTQSNDTDQDKVAVVDWYYKVQRGPQKILHYCKFCGDVVLYASEDDPACANGFYQDGDYPFVMDILFPMEGTLMGLGYIDRCKHNQETIDQLDQAITLNALANALPRYFGNKDTGVNVEDFFDLTKLIIEVEGSLSEDHLRPATVPKLDGACVTILNNKIEELKQTSGNQDVNNGVTSGVTSAAGIASLQQAAGRSSKDGIVSTYQAYSKIINLVIERIRQFYSMPRTFRIMGQNYQEEFTEYTNAGLQMQPLGLPGHDGMMRKPVFDVSVDAQKQNAYSKMAQNELGLQLLNAGVFNPQMIDQSKLLIDFMDFNGKERIMQKLDEMGGIQQQLMMMQSIALQLAQEHEPQMAEQLAAMIMGQAGQPMPMQTAQVNIPEKAKESSITVKAKERAAQASQPA